ncbi:PLP-dependent aminotransferase family protein, partial [Bacillus cereus]|nr:PLP-dependent aminotransferase family protein [Bacillus cereus]
QKVDELIAEGGIHVWCKVKGKFDEYHLLGESIRNGVAFVPGSVLGSKNEYIRFTFGRANIEQIQLGIKRFADTLHEIS